MYFPPATQPYPRSSGGRRADLEEDSVTDGFAVRPEVLAGPAASLDDAADALAAAVSRARDDLAALGDIAGDDEQGRAFASRYGPVAAEGLAAIGRSVDAIGSFGRGMRATSQQYVAGDGGAADAFGGKS
jgi:hypothetical protein